MIANQSKFLVVGLVKNCSKTVNLDVFRLLKALDFSESVSFLLIESDSSDSTLNELEHLKNSISNFEYISLGNLAERFSIRTERLAYCRNVYLDIIKYDYKYKNIDFIVVADFDGINNLICKASFAACFSKSNWDVCTSNQLGPYYDIWALRHSLWCPNDVWSEYEFLCKFTRNKRDALETTIYSKMIIIPPSSDWISVKSAFGGLAIYKKNILSKARYCGLDFNRNPVCEHVPFNTTLIEQGYRIFINPALINSGFNEHNLNKSFFRRNIHRLKRVILRWS